MNIKHNILASIGKAKKLASFIDRFLQVFGNPKTRIQGKFKKDNTSGE
jgi:hypothetical protein